MYTSEELSEIASEAPSDTLSETIEKLCQRDIAKVQLEHYERSHYILTEEFARDFYFSVHNVLPECEHEKAYELQVRKLQDDLRSRTEQTIEALYALRDYRLGALNQEA